MSRGAPVTRRLPRGQETRERILATALRLFAEQGYGAVSIEEIAAESGVTKGAVYHWFADKDDLGRELQHDLYERMALASMRAFGPTGDAVSNIVRAFEAYLALLGDLGEARFFLRDAWVIPALDEAGRRDQEDAVAMLRDILAHAMARGELVMLDADALARVLTAAFAEATLYVLQTGARDETEEVVRHLLGSLRAPRSGRTGPARTTKGARG
jgi:AcrR family transcriptional regulator